MFCLSLVKYSNVTILRIFDLVYNAVSLIPGGINVFNYVLNFLKTGIPLIIVVS